MINNINPTNIKTSIFYINDFHGKTVNMEKAVHAAYEFDSIYKNKKDVDTFTLSSGDIALGENVTANKAAVQFQKIIGVSSAAIGNHEYDIQDNINEVLPKVNYNLLSTNIKINPRNPLSKTVNSSIVEERNGHKYGIIGTSPVDLYKRSKTGTLQRDISVDNPIDTLNDIQYEADKLKKQGVNKIILLSHLGNSFDKILAKNTSGIDVILGGHTHELVFDVKEGENLFFNKDNEPVIITQAGRDGNNFGILNLEFDNNGIVKKVQNNIGYTKNFNRYLPVKYIFDKMFNNNVVLGRINSVPPAPESLLIGVNPHAYFIADCMKNETNSEIALINSANIRGLFEKGELDKRTVADILPFKNKLWKVKYSEKDIVDAVKFAAKSQINPTNKPGLLYASGLKYSICPVGELISMSYVDKNGKETPIDVNHPRTDKFYTTVINDYCAQGNDKFTMLNRPNNIIEKYNFDAADCVERFVQKSNKPIDIKDDGRFFVIQ